MLSILRTTYRGERADRLARSLESFFGQATPADELVLVLDGPVDADQQAVIAGKKVIDSPDNRGLGETLTAGQEHCAGDWIIRMGSAQLAYLRDHPDADLIASWAEEFSDDAPDIRPKTAPAGPDGLLRALRWRNIISAIPA
jgi:glycosyltransferase involved in cell wall biosynthesis